VRITWLGHSTALVEEDGARVLTDPVLRSRVGHLRRHAPAPAPPGPVDAVLVSHVHQDHLDRPSLRAFAVPGTTAVVPRGAGRMVDGLGFGAVREVTAGDAVAVGALDVRAVPAWHEARRRPGAARIESLGFLVADVWFAGDTELHPTMERLRGEVRVALVPIWGWGPSLGPGHLGPQEAARAVALVAPEIAVPIHWGTFLPVGLGRRHASVLDDPPVAFAAAVAAAAPSTRVVTLSPGEALDA
jgi:L-ascorbate metabolism protein UlaG (beta-lactamase superfamily)